MIRTGLKIGFWTLAAFVFHTLTVNTSIGELHVEVPFFLAYVLAARESRPWIAGLTFLIPSLLFDALDNQFAGTLSHMFIFFSIRRLKGYIDFARAPGCMILGLIAAALDRSMYGILVGFTTGEGLQFLVKAVMDPAYLLTVIILPLGFVLRRQHTS